MRNFRRHYPGWGSLATPHQWIRHEMAWQENKMAEAGRRHGRTARGGHGLPKVSPGPAMPDPSMPCGRATPETALQQFRGRPAHRVGSLRRLLPFWTPHAVRLWEEEVSGDQKIKRKQTPANRKGFIGQREIDFWWQRMAEDGRGWQGQFARSNQSDSEPLVPLSDQFKAVFDDCFSFCLLSLSHMTSYNPRPLPP